MNGWYQRLIRALDEIGRRMEQWQRRYEERPGESAEVAGKIRQSSSTVQDGIRQLRFMLAEAAEKDGEGVPAEWDLVSVVPADKADPEAAERSGTLPEAKKLDEAFRRGMDGFEHLKELIKTYSRRPPEERLFWAEEVEQIGKEFHRIYQLSRDAHDANWHDRYD